ncbi:MAG TPA: chemotaxis protein CheA, partial [Anaeromyxobacter sp.]|nr:chemotaxis protein CheA [Anaeromyxobacter sp.]
AGYDPNAAAAYDPNAAGYDPNAAGYDPNAAAAYDPNAAGYDPNAAGYDPSAAAAYDPNAAGYDPNAAVAYDPSAAGYDPNAAAAYDPNAGAYDPTAAGYDPNAPGYAPEATALDAGEVAPEHPAKDGLAFAAQPPAERAAAFDQGEAAPAPQDESDWSSVAVDVDGAPAEVAAPLPGFGDAEAAQLEANEPLLGQVEAPAPLPGEGEDPAWAPQPGGDYDATAWDGVASAPSQAEPALPPDLSAPLDADPSALAEPRPAPSGDLAPLPPDGWAPEAPPPVPATVEFGAYDEAATARTTEDLEALLPFDPAAESAVGAEALRAFDGPPADLESAGFGHGEVPSDVLEREGFHAAPSVASEEAADWQAEPALVDRGFQLESGGSFDAAADAAAPEWAAPSEPMPWEVPPEESALTAEPAFTAELATAEASAPQVEPDLALPSDPEAAVLGEPEAALAETAELPPFELSSPEGEPGGDAAWAAPEAGAEAPPPAEPEAATPETAALPPFEISAAEGEPGGDTAWMAPEAGAEAPPPAEPEAAPPEIAELPPFEISAAEGEPGGDTAWTAPPAIDLEAFEEPEPMAAGEPAPAGFAENAAEEPPPAALEDVDVPFLDAAAEPMLDDLPTLEAEEIVEEVPAEALTPLEPVPEAVPVVPPPAALEEPPAYAQAPEPYAEVSAPLAEALPATEAAAAAEAPPVEEPPAPPVPEGQIVRGVHRAVVHTIEGQVKRGFIENVDLGGPALPLSPVPGADPEILPADHVKAIFFMLPPGEQPPPPQGNRVRVTFRDGRQVAGFSPDYREDSLGFFMIPADARTSTGRIWVYRTAVKAVAVS